MKIIYVGVKEDGETAFASQTGIERWMQGDVHDIPTAVAARMLEHPDVFAKADEARRAPAPEKAAPEPPEPVEAAVADTAVDTSSVTLAPGAEVKAAVRALAAKPAAKSAKKAPSPPKAKAAAPKKGARSKK